MSSNGKPPSGWQEYRLCEVGDVRFSSVDKHIREGQRTVRLCNYLDVWKNPYIHRDLNFMEGTASEDEFDKFSLRLGDVLLTKDSETREEIAEPSVVHEQIENLVLGYHLALIRPAESLTNGPFLAAQLRIPQFRRQFIKGASGVTRYGLGLDTVRNAIVWLPCPLVQSHIATIIRAVDEAIEATRAVIGQTRRLKSALLQELLTKGLPGRHRSYRSIYRIGRIPAEWSDAQLGEVAEVTQGIAIDPSRTPKFQPTPYLRVANVQQGSLDLNEVKKIETSEGERKNLGLMVNDVLMVEGHANIEELGRAALVPKAAEGMVFQNHLFRVRPDRNRLDPRFLTTWVNSPSGRRYFKIFGGTTSGLNTVGSGQIRALRLPLPEINEQHAICDMLQSLDDRVLSAENDLNQLVSVKSALSQGLLTGKIPVSVPAAKSAANQGRDARKSRKD